MAARRSFTPPKAAPSALFAALTATDQLTARERQQAAAIKQQQRQDDRYEAWQRALAAYHDAMAASARALLARMHNYRDRHSLCALHSVAALDLIWATDRFVRLPIVSHDDLKERKVLVRRFQQAMAGLTTSATWKDHQSQWEDILARVDVPGRRQSAKKADA